MAIANVVGQLAQDIEYTGSAFAARTITLPSNWTVGNALLIAITWLGTTETVTASDVAGNTYTTQSLRVSLNSSTFWIICKQLQGTPSQTITLTFSSAVQYPVLWCREITGQDTTTQPDVAAVGQSQGSPGTGTDAITSGNMTTVTNGCMVYSFFFREAYGMAAGNTTAGTGFTADAENNDAGTFVQRQEYRLQASAGVIAGTWTQAVNGITNCGAIALRPAATALKSPPNRRMNYGALFQF
jgi:hypothetical protein